MFTFYCLLAESPMKKMLKKAEKKAKCKGKTPTKRVEDVTTELYPIDKTVEETMQEDPDILAKYVSTSQHRTYNLQTLTNHFHDFLIVFCFFLFFYRETPLQHQVSPEGTKIILETLHRVRVRESKVKQKPTHTVMRAMVEQQEQEGTAAAEM